MEYLVDVPQEPKGTLNFTGSQMRLLPIQIGVLQICGEVLGGWDEPLATRIQNGHAMLVLLTGEDFGYDLEAWHNHLKETRTGGYTYRRKMVLPRIMQTALQSSEWQEAVRNLVAGR